MKSPTRSSEVKARKPSGAETYSAGIPTSDVLTHEDLQILKAPLPRENLGVKVQSFSKDRNRALLVLYLQHTDVQDRLEQVDPAWTLEILSEERLGDTVYVRARMQVKGVSRENVGEGSDPKAAYSDALKRCAMLFGVGRYLYDSETVWADYNEARDRFRQWTVEDYDRAATQMRKPTAPVTPPPRVEAAEAESAALASPGLTTASKKDAPRTREQLNRVLMSMYRPYLSKFPETRFVDLLQSRYGVAETRLMSLEQMEDLVKFMEQRLQPAA